MHALRLSACAIVIATTLTACAPSDRVADTTTSSGAIAADPMNESTPASAPVSGAVSTASAAGIGRYLTDASGCALYMFERDTKNTSTCFVTDGCAVAWPPFSAGAPT